MKIAVFGLGYVGSTSAACLARAGHTVVGVDPNPAKVDLINAGRSPIIEDQVEELISAAVGQKKLRAVSSAEEAVSECELSFVCVGTPSRRNGSLDTRAIERVCREIGVELKKKGRDSRHIVVMRSTVLPGMMEGLVVPALEESSGLKAGTDFGVANNPEFLREGTAVYDFENPPKTVIGSRDAWTSDAVAQLYQHLDAPLIKTTMVVAEFVKYTDNAWHAVKVAFGNEIGNLCKARGADSHAVMDIFFQDVKLNLSRAYLTPGYAFGGSCLPKDLRALVHEGRQLDLELPLLNAVLRSNAHQIERAFEHIERLGRRKIGFLGVSFKYGTDDLRESPQISLVERLIGKGYDVRVYDRHVHLARLTGANREVILKTVPHIAEILSDDLKSVVAHGELVVIGNKAPEFSTIGEVLRPDQCIFDLARVDALAERGMLYEGANW